MSLRIDGDILDHAGQARYRKRIRKYIAEQEPMAAIELDERIGYSASSPGRAAA